MYHQIPSSNINKMYGNNFGEFIIPAWACARRATLWQHCFSFNVFVLFFQLPARLRTRWSLWWKTATPAQANQMKKVTRMNTWYVFTFFLILHFFFLRKTLNESCLPCEITGLLSWMAEGRPCIYCRHFTFPKTILQLLPQWPCLWMAARQWGRK